MLEAGSKLQEAAKWKKPSPPQRHPCSHLRFHGNQHCLLTVDSWFECTDLCSSPEKQRGHLVSVLIQWEGMTSFCSFVPVKCRHLPASGRSAMGYFARTVAEAETHSVSSCLMLEERKKNRACASSTSLLSALSCASDTGFEEEIMTFKRISQAL